MRGYVDVETGQIHYRSAGEAGPVVALFHESPLNSRIYERALPLLATDLRAWAFDTPGYGLSDPPPAPIEIPGYARLLLQAVDACGVGNFAVAGVHTGASIAIEVARQAEVGRVTAAVLSGVPLFTEEERVRYLDDWAPDISLDPEGAHLTSALARYQRIWGADSPAELLHEGVVAILSGYQRYNWAYNAAFRYDPGPALEELRCPLLLLNAEHDLLRDTDARVRALVPRAELVLVRGHRGQLPWRAPEEYADNLRRFVRGSTNVPGAATRP